MDKKKKILAIALISLVALILGFVIVYWAVFGKEEVIALFGRVKDFINQPLPIIGITFATAAVIAFRFLSLSSWGKKAAEEQERKFAQFKAEQERKEAEAKAEAERYRISLEKFVGEIKKGQWVSESDLTQVESYIRTLPFKGAREFRLEHKGKEEESE